jgi:hypothetical protein
MSNLKKCLNRQIQTNLRVLLFWKAGIKQKGLEGAFLSIEEQT